jgi:hypothetical protein
LRRKRLLLLLLQTAALSAENNFSGPHNPVTARIICTSRQTGNTSIQKTKIGKEGNNAALSKYIENSK